MMKIKMIAALMLVSANSMANDSWMEINGWSNHIGKDWYMVNGEQKKKNELNLGLGYAREVHENVEFKGGFYENSYYKNTLYASAMFHFNIKAGDWKIKPGIVAGIVTGYDDITDASPVQPIASPLVNIEYKRVRVGVGYMPGRLFGRKSDIMTANFGFKL